MKLTARNYQKVQNLSMAKGFTLIELLVVIGILAILLAITLIAINPARQFQQANDTQRASDVNTILNAINQYMADNNGTPPAGIPVAPDDAANVADTGADLCAALVPDYVAALPVDPTSNAEPVSDCDEAYDTQYTVVQGEGNRITVSAPNAEIQDDISVTR